MADKDSSSSHSLPSSYPPRIMALILLVNISSWCIIIITVWILFMVEQVICSDYISYLPLFILGLIIISFKNSPSAFLMVCLLWALQPEVSWLGCLRRPGLWPWLLCGLLGGKKLLLINAHSSWLRKMECFQAILIGKWQWTFKVKFIETLRVVVGLPWWRSGWESAC